MIIFTPKLLNISWHNSGLCQAALAQTIPGHSSGIMMFQERFQQAPHSNAALCASWPLCSGTSQGMFHLSL